MKQMIWSLGIFAALVSMPMGPAFAHARLERAMPGAGAIVAPPARVVLTFSEALEPAFSGATLTDAKGHDVTGAAPAISGRTMTLSPGRLVAGSYRVAWHSVGDDTHRLEGAYSFTVK